MAHAQEPAADMLSDEVKPYKIRVSSKYLELTRRKLELTRLPHQTPEPRSINGWWEPQPTVEPLVDFWLERFSWREQEQQFNARVPQFRTAIKTAALETPVRMHFVHASSRHAHAMPLLLIPPFPFTNLSMAHLIDLFTEPGDGTLDQPFHLVMPSLPGLGFRDALPDSVPLIQTVAHMLHVLMKRLGYEYFLVTNSGPWPSVLAPVDWELADHLALHYPNSCLGAHFVSPPFSRPRIRDSPAAWTRWKVASILRAPILGYSLEDLEALRSADTSVPTGARASPHAILGFGNDGAHEPNTLAYALCDSPLGLLLFFLMVLRMSGPNRGLPPAEIVRMTELTWLPGPEGTMRLWAQCAAGEEKQKRRRAQRPKAAITVFSGDQGRVGVGPPLPVPLPRPFPNSYACPAWGRRQYHVVACNRVTGRPGLLAWERPQVIVVGVRSLAKAVLAADGRIGASGGPKTTILKRVVVDGGQKAAATTSETIQAPEATPGNRPQETVASGSEPDRQQVAGPSEREAWKQPMGPLTPQHQGIESPGDGDGSRGGSPDTVIAVQIGA
ncbi:epoxide hydrolase [Ophiocordyceps sinensis CO18]|uniref:Epoxide hydrolase n=1 Tax=Ophiocordyceps sinensis (strain Co18 / CGMCC 3.14243) TaxID=911162 RepID=T5ANY3_OPHSC|nr:epoxide hydrolase [Ophiocordyceps sinensis CO18]